MNFEGLSKTAAKEIKKDDTLVKDDENKQLKPAKVTMGSIHSFPSPAWTCWELTPLCLAFVTRNWALVFTRAMYVQFVEIFDMGTSEYSMT